MSERINAPGAGGPHVVIVGGGFGGLYAARALGRRPVRVTVVDRANYHLFQPLLYQVATAALSPGDIAQPIRGILRRYPNIRVLLGEATAIDLAGRRVRLADGGLPYDYLILATGARHAYFGHDDWAALAPGLKSLDDAMEVRRRILDAFERAERATDPAARRALLTFVVVGGGPTGVELAGAIAEIARHTIAGDFRAIDPAQARVVLAEGRPHLLPGFPADLSAAAERMLRGRGIEVRTAAIVTRVTPDAVQLGAEAIPTHTVLWAAGVTASPLGHSLGVPLDRSGRVLVRPDLTVPGHPEVYVIGDLAAFADRRGRMLPGLAPVAMQQGRAAAENIWRAIRGRPRRRFRYFDRGTLATVGRAAAVADLRGLRLAGLDAWLAWLFVHLYFLIGFEQRLRVLSRWAWSYLTYRRGVRLILAGPPAAAPPAAPEAPRDLPTWAQAVKDLPASAIMTREVLAVPPAMPAHDVAALLEAHRLSGVPVVDEGGRLLGLVSELDLFGRQGVTAGDIMSPHVVTVGPETGIAELARLFVQHRIRRVPVLAGDRLAGIVSRADLLRGLLLAGAHQPEPDEAPSPAR